jgi:transposase
VTWRTVRKALDSAWPEPRKRLPPRATALDPYKPVIDEILRADLDAPRKQRHTVTRIFHRLVEEHGADVSYGIVRYYVAGRKPEILLKSGKAPLEAFVPQTHQPGHEAEVDFGDVTVRLGGELVTCYLFSFRLSYSGKAVHRVFASCGQEAFFEGHVHALRTLGGVPRSKVRYDNLKAAVARVLGLSRARVEADRHGAELLFQVLTEREEKNSVAIASNESFGGWTKTFTDPRLCAAIVDRLTFNGTIIETGTDSYRLASTRARAEEPAKAG